MTSKVFDWVKDWIGRANVERRKDDTISPFAALQQALAVLALALSGTLLDYVDKTVSPQTLIFVKVFLLIIIVVLANQVIIAKKPIERNDLILSSPRTSGKLAYRYTEIDRLASKLVVIFSIGLTIILVWPKTGSCKLTVQFRGTESAPAIGRGLDFEYIEIAGADQRTRFAFNKTGKTNIEILPSQVKRWSFTVVGSRGEELLSSELRGCLHEKREFELTGKNAVLMLSPP
ncbi:hypothetical protein [Desulfoferrobacter suflitae]|uniref:hypothetical protein n=1 Tax=Desulfoferrobacter suflitae TaxID=2865782 RepID=UPI002164B03A|nr:hypothetical protein [Desulfoferrobacter suflitae]MCK8604419.1 hypothetical protein [Desulfoferrobacter suflitae]